jgi:phosphoglycerol transferase MdoB-like AlkP superfamily enzyme
MKKTIFKYSFTVFLITLVVLLFLIGSLNYVGVQVIYFGIPTLLISGYLAYLSRPKTKSESEELFGKL